MKPVYNNDIVDYQDYLTWRHNIGPGGTAAVTFAGSIGLARRQTDVMIEYAAEVAQAV